MGVIERQGTKNSIVGMIGVMVGAFATLFIYPNSLEAYGLARFLIDTSAILAPVLVLGIHSLPVKFYPQVKTEDGKDHGFLSFLLLASVISIILVSGVIFWQRSFLLHSVLFWGKEISKDNLVLLQNAKFLLPLGVLTSLSLLLSNYISLYHRITVPAIFNNLLFKIGTAFIIFLITINRLEIDSIGIGLVVLFLVIISGLSLYLVTLKAFNLSRIHFKTFRRLAKSMTDYSSFAVLGGVGYLIAFRIDSIMVATLIGTADNGAYNIALFIGATISIPVIAISAISAPLISSWWESGEKEKIEDLYKKSSINLLIVGIGLFVLVLSCISDLMQILPKQRELEGLIPIVFFLGMARIIDMSLGVKHQIISFSESYRFTLYTFLLLAVLNVFTNLYFIQTLKLGIQGAAIATCISFFAINLIYFFFIKIKFKMQPFSINSVKILLIGIAFFFLGQSLAFNFHPIINIALKSVLIGTFYTALVFFARLSLDYNRTCLNIISYIKAFTNKQSN